MSDPENLPSKQTSSVPLKKETVRVTLKAADAPAASPTGATPAPAAPKPTAAPRPPVPKPPPTVGAPPVPTAPMVPQGPPRAPAPAPTIALRTAGGGPPSSPAPTIRLNTGGAATAPLSLGAPAAPGQPAPTVGINRPGPTVALPKATVQLNPPTQPLGTQGPAASQMATMQVSEEESHGGSNGIVNVISILGFVGAAAVIAIQLMTSAIWLGVDSNGEKQKIEWGNLF